MNHTKPGLAAAGARPGRNSPADDKNPPTPTPRIRYLHRQTLPFKAALAVWTAGWLAEAAVAITDDRVNVTLATAAVTGIAAAVVATVAGKKLSGKQKLHLRACLAAGATWLAIAAGTGMTWDNIGLLGIGTTVLSLPWWRTHRIPTPPQVVYVDEPQEVAPPPKPAGPPTIPQLWEKWLSPAGTAFAGSTLEDADLSAMPERESYTVQLKPGKQSIETLRTNKLLLASGLFVPVSHIMLEEHESKDASKVRITIIHSTVLDEPVPYQAGLWEYDEENRVGTVNVGPFQDGTGHAKLKIVTRNSVWSTVIIGGTGSGKSLLSESICISLRSSGKFITLFGCPQGGTSSPALAANATYTARGIDEIMEMLRSVDDLVYWRGKENSARDLPGFTLAPNRLGVMVVLAEIHEIFSDPTYGKEATIIGERITRIGRKLGIAGLWDSQEGGLKTFGNSNGLRANAIRGNLVTHHTENKETKHILGLTYDPQHLDKTPGFARIAGNAKSGIREADFRGWYPGELTEEEAEIVAAGGVPRENTGYWWMAKYQEPNPQNDRLLYAALMPLLVNSEEKAEQSKAKQREEIEQLLRGEIDPRGHKPGTASGIGRPSSQTGMAVGEIVDFPAPVDIANPDGPRVPMAEVSTPSKRDVLAAVTKGIAKKGDIMTHTGLSETAVRKALEAFIAEGTVIRSMRGMYALAAPAVADPLLVDRARDIINAGGVASVSVLQRRLNINAAQSKAALSVLESEGLIGAAGPDGAHNTLSQVAR